MLEYFPLRCFLMKLILNGKLYIQKKDLIFLLGENIELSSTIFLREYNESSKDELYIPVEDEKLVKFISEANYIIDKEETLKWSIADLEKELDLVECAINRFYYFNQSKDKTNERNIKKLILKRNALEECLEDKYLRYHCIEIDESCLEPGIRPNEKVLIYYKKKCMKK